MRQLPARDVPWVRGLPRRRASVVGNAQDKRGPHAPLQWTARTAQALGQTFRTAAKTLKPRLYPALLHGYVQQQLHRRVLLLRAMAGRSQHHPQLARRAAFLPLRHGPALPSPGKRAAAQARQAAAMLLSIIVSSCVLLAPIPTFRESMSSASSGCCAPSRALPWPYIPAARWPCWSAASPRARAPGALPCSP